jgi:poly-gamma-glutamate capsule biosynthesis protein CapA/YwtB (metallophosphatase superfamily)
MTKRLEFLATGDLGPCRVNPQSIFSHVHERLKQADLVFGQLEPVLTSRGSPMPQARLAMRSTPNTAAAIREAGFDVISFASNHCMDWGSAGLLDTLDALKANGMQLIGAGMNLTAARAPAFFDKQGTRIAILAYNSILPQGYWATDTQAGCAPMRAWTVQEQIEHDQPGTPSRVHSFAHREDLAALLADVSAAKQQADVVMLSMHWGIHFVPRVIAGYQREVAHAAIDAGVDIVLGHHPHILKGIEVYKGKPVFYSMGNFAIDPPTAFQSDLRSTKSFKEIAALNPRWETSGEHIRLPDSSMTFAVKCEIENKKIVSTSMLPALIDDDSCPRFLSSDDKEFSEIAAQLDLVSKSEGLEVSWLSRGNELVLAVETH